MASAQPSLFETAPRGPEGFRYKADVLSCDEEQALLAELEQLEFQPFEFRGYFGKRQVVSFGWRYDFTHARLTQADPIPPFLEPVRMAAATLAEVQPERFEQVLINAYAPGAGIGWHRDRPQFGDVVAVSLGGAAMLRFRRDRETGWDRMNVPVEARSAYLLRGAARQEWEHSLPPVEALRYSITFRTLRTRAEGRP